MIICTALVIPTKRPWIQRDWPFAKTVLLSHMQRNNVLIWKQVSLYLLSCTAIIEILIRHLYTFSWSMPASICIWHRLNLESRPSSDLRFSEKASVNIFLMLTLILSLGNQLWGLESAILPFAFVKLGGGEYWKKCSPSMSNWSVSSQRASQCQSQEPAPKEPFEDSVLYYTKRI